MAEAKRKAKAKVAPKKATAKKAVAKKVAAKKTVAKKTTVKTKAKAKAQPKAKASSKKRARPAAVDTGRKALLAGLGVYGKAYDQVLEQFAGMQEQVDDAQNRLSASRKQAEAIINHSLSAVAQSRKTLSEHWQTLSSIHWPTEQN